MLSREDFPKPWDWEILTSFVNSHLFRCVRMQYLNYPAKHFRSVEEKVRAYIYCHLTAIFVLVSHVGYKHTPSHSPEFQNQT